MIRPGFGPSDRIIAVTTLAFDIAVLELFLPLAAGGRTIVAEKGTLSDPRALADLINGSGATVMQATPSLWQALLDANFKPGPDLKILCGGEPLPSDLAERLLSWGASLWNMYGPTETTVWSSCAEIRDAALPITIGEPIANTLLAVIEPGGKLSPIG